MKQRLIKITLMILITLTIWMTLSARPISAQGSSGSLPMTQPTPPISTTAIPVPEKYKDDKFIQLVLSAYENEKNKRVAAEQRIQDLTSLQAEIIKSREEWKGLYN